MTVAQLRALLEKAPDHYNIYFSGYNASGDNVHGDVVSVVLSREGDLVLSNEPWDISDVEYNHAVILA